MEIAPLEWILRVFSRSHSWQTASIFPPHFLTPLFLKGNFNLHVHVYAKTCARETQFISFFFFVIKTCNFFVSPPPTNSWFWPLGQPSWWPVIPSSLITVTWAFDRLCHEAFRSSARWRRICLSFARSNSMFSGRLKPSFIRCLFHLTTESALERTLSSGLTYKTFTLENFNKIPIRNLITPPFQRKISSRTGIYLL